jgi:hypothetical protein
MLSPLFCAVPLLVLLIGVQSEAQVDPQGGKLRTKLTDALSETAKGNCSEDLLAPMVLDACEQQLSRMKPMLESLGPIKNVRYRGLDQLPNGVQVEVYRVVFTSGQMTWVVAAGPNGKLTVLWTQG